MTSKINPCSGVVVVKASLNRALELVVADAKPGDLPMSRLRSE